jgi:hypothetical protein
VSDPVLDNALATIEARKAEIRAIASPSEQDEAELQELRRREFAIRDAIAAADAEGESDDAPEPGVMTDEQIAAAEAGVAEPEDEDDEPLAVQAGLVRAPATPYERGQGGHLQPAGVVGWRRPEAPGPPVDPLTAFARGIRNPFGMSDELAGIGAAVASQFDDTRPMTAATSARAGRAAELEDQARAAEQHPVQYGAGRALTTAAITAPTMVSPAGIAAAVPRATALGRAAAPLMTAAQPVTTAGRVAAGAGEGAVLGGAIGAAESEPGQRLEGAAAGSMGGLVLGGAIPGGVAGARRLVDPLENFASRMRGAAPGAYGSNVTQITKDKGRDYLAEMGRTIERRGIDQRVGVGPLRARLPMGSGAYQQRLDDVLPQVGAEMDSVIMQAEQAGSKVPVSWLRNRLLNRAKELEATTGKPESAIAQARKLRDIAESLPDKKIDPTAQTHYSPRELQALKESWADEAFTQRDFSRPKGGTTAEAYREAARVPRTVLDEQITRKVSPEQAQRFQQAREEYGHLKTARDMATKREGQETGNQLVSLPTMLAAGAGVGAGGASYAGDGDPLTSALIAGGTMALTKRYGKDALASLARATQKGMQRVSRAPVAADVNAAALAARQSPSMATPALADAPQSLTIDDAYAQVEQDPDAFGDATDAVLDAIDANDQDALNAALQQVR